MVDVFALVGLRVQGDVFQVVALAEAEDIRDEDVFFAKRCNEQGGGAVGETGVICRVP